MTRLDRIIKSFNDYDDFVKNNTVVGYLESKCLPDKSDEAKELQRIRYEVSMLLGELRKYGCRREN